MGGCNTCSSISIKFEIQSYFNDSISCLHLDTISISDILILIEKDFITDDLESIKNMSIKGNSGNAFDKNKYLAFIKDKIIKNYIQTAPKSLIFPDYKKFLDYYFIRLYDNFNYGVEQLILYLLFFVNKQNFSSNSEIKNNLENILSKLIFFNKKDSITFNSFKSMLGEVIYNIIILPAICLYLLTSGDYIKKEIQLLLENQYTRENINSYLFSELKVLDLYTFFSKEDLRRLFYIKEFEDVLFFKKNFSLYSWEYEQLLIGFNSYLSSVG